MMYHFIGYTLHSGKVYELDGLKSGPTLIGFLEEGKDWISVLKSKVNNKMKMLTENDSNFHLFALVTDIKEAVIIFITQTEDNLQKDKAIKSEIEKKLELPIELEISAEEKIKYKDVLEKLSDDKTTLQSMYNIVKVSITKEESDIKTEEERRKKQYDECIKRGFNYIPFLLSMLNSIGRQKAIN